MRTVSRLIGLGCLLLSIAGTNCNDTNPSGTTDLGTTQMPDQSMGLGVSAISPAGGVNTGGTTITISGQSFQTGATVTVGGTACQNVTVVNPTTITCTTPAKAGTCGAATVVVTNPDGQSTSRSDLFAYKSATLSFSPMNTISTGTSPRFVALDDWNGDGKVDLAVGLISGTGQVNIHNGDGQGGFGAGNGITAGMQPRDILSKDLNGDGKLDLIVANQMSNTITIHLGTGTGFAPPTSLTTPMGPQGLAMADSQTNSARWSGPYSRKERKRRIGSGTSPPTNRRETSPDITEQNFPDVQESPPRHSSQSAHQPRKPKAESAQ